MQKDYNLKSELTQFSFKWSVKNVSLQTVKEH